jgi:predicted PurR-regulated permease PerM
VPGMTPTSSDRFRPLLFYALVLGMGYLAFRVLQPFLAPLAWAAIFAMMFSPVHAQLRLRTSPVHAALSTTLIAALLVVAPAVLIISMLVQEVPETIEYFKGLQASTPAQIESLWAALRARVPFDLPEDPASLITQGLQRLLGFVAPRAGALLADVAGVIGSLFIMLFILFFFLRDGEWYAAKVRGLLPMAPDEGEQLITSTRDMVVASVGTGVVVSATQGAIGGLAFWILGIGSPVVWGVAMAFCSLIPMVGAALVWLPAALWLMASGDMVRALVLIGIGVGVIGTADNVLRPLILSGRTEAGGLVIFIGLLGGVNAFGFIGLVLGPIVLVTAASLLNAFTRVPRPAHAAPDPTRAESAATVLPGVPLE